MFCLVSKCCVFDFLLMFWWKYFLLFQVMILQFTCMRLFDGL